jgi:hypothetical protein
LLNQLSAEPDGKITLSQANLSCALVKLEDNKLQGICIGRAQVFTTKGGRR